MKKRNIKKIGWGVISLSALTLASCGPEGGGTVTVSTPGDDVNTEGSTYSVGGSVSGINGVITLQVNGGNDFDISENGEYTISGEFTEGFYYSLTVLAQPQLQECVISNGLGSVGSADVGNIVLSCSDKDTDEDGLTDRRELEYGTLIGGADTDGDGFTDGQEVDEFDFNQDLANFRYNPLIADVPQLLVEIATVPSIWVNNEEGTSIAVETENGGSVTSVNETSYTGGFSTGFEVGFEGTASVGLFDWGEFTNSFKFNAETQYSWSELDSWSNEDTWSEITSEENTSVYNGGGLSVGVILKNIGHTAFTVKNLVLSGSEFTYDYLGYSLIGNLVFNEGTFAGGNSFQLTPGSETGVLSFEKQDLTTQQATDLMRSNAITVSPASYNLEAPAESTSYLKTAQDVEAVSVLVNIDYASNDLSLRPELYQVAVRNNEGTTANLADLLNILAGDPSFEFAFGLDPLYEKNRLASVRNQQANGAWAISVVQATGNTESDKIYYHLADANENYIGVDIIRDYTAEDIVLTGGDKVSLTYFRDSDDDGIGDRIERLVGIFGDGVTKDYDNDGLSDVDELAGWEVSVAREDLLYAGGVNVSSDVTRGDADGDGLLDVDERNAGLDPSNPDTDDDGISDGSLIPDGSGLAAGPDTENVGYLSGNATITFDSLDVATVNVEVVPIDGLGWLICTVQINDVNTTIKTVQGESNNDGTVKYSFELDLASLYAGNLDLSSGATDTQLMTISILVPDTSGLIFRDLIKTKSWGLTDMKTGFGNSADWNQIVPDGLNSRIDNPMYLVDLDSKSYLEFAGINADGLQYVSFLSGKPELKTAAGSEHFATGGTDWNWDNQRYIVDMNNDGIVDIVGYGDAPNGLQIALGSVTNDSPPTMSFGSPVEYGTDNFASESWNHDYKYVMDMDGDGFPDFLGYRTGDMYVASNPGGWLSSISTLEAMVDGGSYWTNNTFGQNNPDYQRMEADINADGLMDILGFGRTNVVVSLGESPSGTYQIRSRRYDLPEFAIDSSPSYSSDDNPRQFADVNGDGFLDIVGFGPTGVLVALNNMASQGGQWDDSTYADGWDAEDPTTQIFLPVQSVNMNNVNTANGYDNVPSGNVWYSPAIHIRQVVDVDNDGLNDIVIFHDDEVKVFYNETVNGATADSTDVQFSTPQTLTDQIKATDSIWKEVGSSYSKYRPRGVADINRDGIVDVWGLSTEGIKVIWSTTEN